MHILVNKEYFLNSFTKRKCVTSWKFSMMLSKLITHHQYQILIKKSSLMSRQITFILVAHNQSIC